MVSDNAARTIVGVALIGAFALIIWACTLMPSPYPGFRVKQQDSNHFYQERTIARICRSGDRIYEWRGALWDNNMVRLDGIEPSWLCD